MEYKCDQTNVKLLSILSYIGPLFIIGRFSVEYDDKSLRFHVKQGESLFILVSALYIIASILVFCLGFAPALTETIEFLSFVGITVFWIILLIMGISGAAKGSQKELPMVGIVQKAVKWIF